MKTLLLTSAFILVNLSLFAQNWIEKGATWHYDYWFVGGAGFIKYEYKSDTSIQERLCQKITETNYIFGNHPDSTTPFLIGIAKDLRSFYTYNSGDTVYYYEDSTFNILYDIGASISDSWKISEDRSQGCLPTIVSVIDTGTTFIGGQNRRWIITKTNKRGDNYFSGRIIEGIGMAETSKQMINSTLFPRLVLCDTNAIPEYHHYTFKCFGDSLFTIYNPSGEDCEHGLTHLNDASQNSEEPLFSIYPNPATNRIIFSAKKSLEYITISLFNPIGKKVNSISPQSNRHEYSLSIEALKPGIYFYKIQQGNRTIQTGRFIKI